MDAPSGDNFVERIDALPSPSPLALRLLAAAQDDRSDAHDLVPIIRQDSALTARVLSMCRRGPRGRAIEVASLDRAVVLLGFGAVRSAALAVEFVGSLSNAGGSAARGFDPLRFWRHSLAKAIVAEAAAKLARGVPGAGRPFVAGLLHDLGAIALARACPAVCDRCCDDAERTGRSLDEVAAESVGLSVSAIGARLAVRWNLPEEIIETQRMRGDAALAASLPYRGLVLLTELADRAVRRRHLGGAGFGPANDSTAPLLDALAIDPARFAAALDGLFDEVAARAETLGLAGPSAASLAAESIERATQRLDASRCEECAAGNKVTDELDAASDPAGVLSCIVRQIGRRTSCEIRLLAVSAAAEGTRRELREFSGSGALLASRTAGDGDPDAGLAVRRWCELRGGAGHAGRLVLAARGATLATIYRADGDVLSTSALAQAPVSLWVFAFSASLERQRARRAAERSAEAARLVVACRDRFARDRALASVGEITAGLAHELNNPLTVASGRAQLLRRTGDHAFVSGLDEVISAIETASGLVAHLLRVVRPTRPAPRNADASEIIALALRFLPCTIDAGRVIVRDSVPQSAPPVCFADPAQAADALAEVIQNALVAAPSARVEVSAECAGRDSRCSITVRDAGPGFSERALAHALDPFFSERPSGRGAGLGLAKARSLAEASGGSIEIRNGADGGAIVTIAFPCSGEGMVGERSDGRGEGRGPTEFRRDAA